jgi:hypothetical protein
VSPLNESARFLTLPDVVWAPPLPALVAVVLVVSLWSLGARLASRLRSGHPDELDPIAGFILLTGLVAALVHGLAWAKLAELNVLRGLAGVISLLGTGEFLRNRREYQRQLTRLYARLREATSFERLGVVVVVVSVVALGFASLGPATDSDSLSYHLGVPLDWLRRGAIEPRSDWMHTRLAGFGEVIALLGLSVGTDCLGAALQWSGLLCVGFALASYGSKLNERILAWLIVTASPVVLFLVPNQKAQMLPVAATTIALTLTLRRRGKIEVCDAVFVWGGLGFAVGCKLSFLFSGACVLALFLFEAHRSHRLRMAVVTGLGLFVVLLLPIFLRKYLYYGDPLSPAFESWKPSPAVSVLNFGAKLRNSVRPHTMGAVAELFREVLVPESLGGVSKVLGVGALSFLVFGRRMGATKILVVLALFTGVLVMVFGSLEPRYVLEPYLWLGAVAVASVPSLRRRWWFRLLVAQGLWVALAACFGAIRLFPGAFTVSLREAVLNQQASGYAESTWLNRVLPLNTVIATNSRFGALLPRPFVILEPQYDAISWRNRAITEMRRHHVSTLVITEKEPSTEVNELARECGKDVANGLFSVATRNPSQNQRRYGVRVVDVRGCWGDGKLTIVR